MSLPFSNLMNLSKLIKVDVQHCTLGFESWSYMASQMTLNLNRNHTWINPEINHTLNRHTMSHKFMDSNLGDYGSEN